ncbi:hypothetical protein [Mycobacterium colombiense]|uniref:hypothetical protein n=1 Tax=Mycobacterium colombiense TaxID=339268 RepID=UPI00200AFCF4|nr:hypothetical protein [Mycobacterium colombiense]MCK8644395.1 hypothetical protein [Mycobacterium colombiense]
MEATRYHLSSDQGGTVFVSNLQEGIEHLPGDLKALAVDFVTSDLDSPYYRIGVWLFGFKREGGLEVDVEVTVSGPMGLETSGLSEQTKLRLDRAVAQLKDSDTSELKLEPVASRALPPTPAAALNETRQTLAPPTPPTEQPVPHPASAASRGRWHWITNQPLGVQVFGGLVATLGGTGIIALITFIVHHIH